METSLSSVKGHRVDEIRFKGNPGIRLIFRGDYEALSELTIEGTITMRRGTDEHVLDDWAEGRWNPSVFSPLLELLDATVTDVFVSWTLLTFSNGWELSVRNEIEREPGWMFRSGKNASKDIAKRSAW